MTDGGIDRSTNVTDRKAVGVGFEPHEADQPPQVRIHLWCSTTERPYLTTSFSGGSYCNDFSNHRIYRGYTTLNPPTEPDSSDIETDNGELGRRRAIFFDSLGDE